MAVLSNVYDPKEAEPRIQNVWQEKGIFQFDPRHSNDILRTLCSHMRLCFGAPQHIYIQLSKMRAVALAEDDHSSEGKNLLVSTKPDVCSKTKTARYSNQSQVRDIVWKLVSSLLPKVPDDSSPLMATGLDSLGMHLAIALEKRIIALFGPTANKEVHLYNLGEVIIADRPCAPCLSTYCEMDTVCLDKISVDDVLNKVEKIWN